jgi:hypothetical protein
MGTQELAHSAQSDGSKREALPNSDGEPRFIAGHSMLCPYQITLHISPRAMIV